MLKISQQNYWMWYRSMCLEGPDNQKSIYDTWIILDVHPLLCITSITVVQLVFKAEVHQHVQ